MSLKIGSRNSDGTSDHAKRNSESGVGLMANSCPIRVRCPILTRIATPKTAVVFGLWYPSGLRRAKPRIRRFARYSLRHKDLRASAICAKPG